MTAERSLKHQVMDPSVQVQTGNMVRVLLHSPNSLKHDKNTLVLTGATSCYLIVFEVLPLHRRESADRAEPDVEWTWTADDRLIRRAGARRGARLTALN